MQVSSLFHFIIILLFYHYSSQHIHNPHDNLTLALVNKDEICREISSPERDYRNYTNSPSAYV